MDYNGERIIRCKITPAGTYKIIRNCSGCGSKSTYVNTGHFRVNANGNQVDIWLIYQCEKCKHTYNLTIHERIKPSEIPAGQYLKYMENDEELAYLCGNDRQLLGRNRAEIDWDSAAFELKTEETDIKSGTCIIIENPHGMKLRTDRVAAELFSVSRSKIRKWLSNGWLKADRRSLDESTCLILAEIRGEMDFDLYKTKLSENA